MKKNILKCLPLILFLVVSNCGKKAELVLPSSFFIAPVEKTVVFQRGMEAIITWTNPTKYENGRPIKKLSKVELWLDDQGQTEQSDNRRQQVESLRLILSLPWKDFARYLARPESDSQSMFFHYSLSRSQLGRKLRFFIRVFDWTDHPSDFSKPVILETIVCPLPPQDLAAETRAGCIRLTWNPPPAMIDGSTKVQIDGYNIYRAEEGGEYKLVGICPADLNSFEDTDFEFDKKYAFVARAFLRNGPQKIESSDSEECRLLTVDVFPPEPPTDLVVVSGPEGMHLSWTPSSDRDLAGYKVWRREKSADSFILLTARAIEEVYFNDHAAASGKTYQYAVSAIDKYGNEGQKIESMYVLRKEKQL